MIDAKLFSASVPIHVPPPTERDLQMREAAAAIGRAERFYCRQVARDCGLKIEPKATIYFATGFRGGAGPATPCTFGGGPLDEMLPGESEWIRESKERV